MCHEHLKKNNYWKNRDRSFSSEIECSLNRSKPHSVIELFFFLFLSSSFVSPTKKPLKSYSLNSRMIMNQTKFNDSIPLSNVWTSVQGLSGDFPTLVNPRT